MRDFKGKSLLDFPSTYAVIDVETTGLDPTRDSLIEVAAIKFEDCKEISSFSSLINPGVPVDTFITNLTGITNEELATAPDARSVLQKLYNFIGDDVVIGHNVHFDINFLYDNFEKFLGKAFSNNFVDTLRLSKRHYKKANSYKLSHLANYLNITIDTSHRALADCYTTNALYLKLREEANNPVDYEKELLDTLVFDESNPFYQKRIAVKGLPKLYSFAFMKAVSKKCQAKLSDIFYSSCNYIIFSKYTYERYVKGEFSENFIKADELVSKGTLTVLSEEEWCRMLGIPLLEIASSHSASKLSVKDITTDKTDFDETHPLFNKLCVFTGTLEKMARKDAMQIVVDFGGQVGNSVTKKTNYLILGNNDYCPLIKDGKSSKQKKAEALKLDGSDIEIISEDVFYDLISEE